MKHIVTTVAGAILFSSSLSSYGATLSGDLVKWHPVTLDVQGPLTSESDVIPHPFLDYRLDVTMTAPSGTVYQVPGFFAGNGQGNGTGTLWRIRFNPDESGVWRYEVDFKTGDKIAVANDSVAGRALAAHGETGEFTISARDPEAPGFLADGRLNYVGEHYLKQADGDFWIKAGVDSPENFFGYAGFDNTVNQRGGIGTGILVGGVHRYAAHIDDWQTGDPEFVSEDTGVNSHGIIGAVNYLSSQGINSLYFLPMNLGGDGRETYPFINTSGSFEDNTHYDISKLYQWNEVLNHMQRKSIAAHIVLNEQESGNTNWLDNGTLGDQRKLFYRELIARYSYLNAVKWNLSEESRIGDSGHREFARYIRSLDWSAHPLATHTRKNDPDSMYTPLLGNTDFDTSSIQFSPENANSFTEQWRTRTREAGWPWVIDMDEIGPARVGLTDENADELRKSVLYPVYFSGGNIEWYFGYHPLPLGGDMRTENFRTREAMYNFMNIAQQFMLEHLPFWEMQPRDSALTGGSATDQVFQKPGSVYAVYLHDGANGRSLQTEQGTYAISWLNPRTGDYQANVTVTSGTEIELGEAPSDVLEDWVVLLKRHTPENSSIGGTGNTVDPVIGSANPSDEFPERETDGNLSPDESVEPGPAAGGNSLLVFALLSGFVFLRRRFVVTSIKQR